jgi:hypothetical protein
MSDARSHPAWGPLGELFKSHFQVAYVTHDSEQAREAAARVLDVGPFEMMDLVLDVIDENESKVDEMQLKVSFALERAFEIVEPVHDPCDLWDSGRRRNSEQPLSFHHVGTVVTDLGPALVAAQERSLPVLRMRLPTLDVAFVDLRSLGCHRVELLCDRSA